MAAVGRSRRRGLRIQQIAPPWFAVPPTGYGGTERIVSSLTEGLIGLGHDVELVASGGSTTRARLVSPYRHPPSDEMGEALVELPHVLAAHERSGDADIVHDHTTLGAAVASVGDGPPVVHTLHGDWTPAICRLMARVGDRVRLVAISHHQAARAPEGVSIAGVVHNGIDVSRYPFTAASSDAHLAFLGRAGADKGADAAVEVAARTGRPLRMAVKVVDADERRWWRQVMGPLLSSTRAEVDIALNADRRQVLDVIAGARALVCPLRWEEPFGLMMVEAAACGTPVVVWERGAATELVRDGETGYLVEPDDIDGLCDAVERSGGLDRGAVRSDVATRFSDRRMVQDYARLYHRILAAASGPEAEAVWAPADAGDRRDDTPAASRG